MAIGDVLSPFREKIEARDRAKAAYVLGAIRQFNKRIRRLVTLHLIRDWFEEDSNDFRREFTSLLDSIESAGSDRSLHSIPTACVC